MSEFDGKTYYEILEIEPTADAGEIRSAFRKVSRKYHPDMPDAPANSEEMSREIGRISAVLMNAASRIEYNREIGLDADGKPMPKSLPVPDYDDDTYTDDTTEDSGIDIADIFDAPVPNQSTGDDTPKRTFTRPGANRPARRPVEDFDPADVNPMDLVDPTKLSWANKDLTQKERIITTHPGMKKLLGFTAAFLALMIVSAVIVGTSGPISLIVALPLVGIVAVTAMGLHWMFTGQPTVTGKFIGALGAAGFTLYYSSMMTKADDPLDLWRAITTGVLLLASSFFAHQGSKARLVNAYVNSRRGKIVFKKKHLMEGQIWGEVGKVADAENFSDHNKEMGVIGEQHTAELMSYLLNIPGTKVFHCLKFPSKDPDSQADVDHAVVNGNKVALIDSKMWSGGLYSWDDAEHIKKTSLGPKKFTSVHKTEFPFAVNTYRQKDFYEADVRGWMTIYSNDGYDVKVDNSNSHGVRLVTPQRMIEEIGAWFTEDVSKLGTVNKGLANAVLLNMKR